MMDSFTTLSFSILLWSGAYSPVPPLRDKVTGEPKGPHLLKKLLYSLLSAGGAKLEVASPYKSWAFQAYLATVNGSNKHPNQSC